MTPTDAFIPDDPWEGATDEDGFPTEPDDAEHYEAPAEDETYAEAIEKTRAELGGETPDSALPEWVQTKFPSLDWEAAYATDFSQVDWLPGMFLERGQQATLIGDGKVGKSLFCLDWCIRVVSGKRFLGDKAHDPLTVVYFDRENSKRDIVTRAQALGAKPADLARLVYKQFPQFDGSLDASERAAVQLVKLAVGHGADIVILDTVSRFIAGKENDSDTWLQLYQLVHAKLKARGIACLRLDHFGKDDDKGSRGSSAKSQDVDAVWELKKAGESTFTGDGHVTIGTQLKMIRTHTRSGLGNDLFQITRRGRKQITGMWCTGETSHELTGAEDAEEANRGTSEVVDALISAGAPKAGRDTLTQWMKDQGMTTYSAKKMGEITSALKERRALDEAA